ncbi:MAG TPA: nucleoside triphosphate pyrophosphatase [Candidatus Binatia bacterium]|nr:nucleoside triphosphate pyrophosphatase [Candidatus Binatia bacterium]
MTAISADRPLVLASGSRYRAELLRRLGVDFIVDVAGVDETALPDEAPAALAARLALAKARAVSARHPERWVLGSDQVAAAGTARLGKPGTVERATAQLRLLSGGSAQFYTAIALVHGPRTLTALDTTVVRFRALSGGEIDRYVAAEPALDCAGSFKCEGLGITLMQAVETRDPTALVGLPLIALRQLLAQAGCALP